MLAWIKYVEEALSSLREILQTLKEMEDDTTASLEAVYKIFENRKDMLDNLARRLEVLEGWHRMSVDEMNNQQTKGPQP